MYEENNDHVVYFLWFIFYFLLYWLILGANAISFLIVFAVYFLFLLFALSPIAEELWRKMSGVRPLRLKQEKDRLLPLFYEVYRGVYQENRKLSKSIKLYIKEDMDVNAFAFGRGTLVLTRGSIDLLSDDGLKGLIAHEFGHFTNKDTTAALFMIIGNFIMSVLVNTFYNIKKSLEKETKKSIIISCLKAPFDVIYFILRGIQFIGDLILMYISRKHEYMADYFALKSGFGKELADVLTEIYLSSIRKPQSIKEQLKSSHPHITIRIERLEEQIYQA